MKNLLFIIGIFFTHTFVAHGASVSITAPTKVESANQFSVLVSLDTGGISVNSIDVSISYPKEILSFKGYKEDGGVKQLWLVAPKDEGGKIHFSGIIPGGVDGLYDPDQIGLQPIPLASLIFSAKGDGYGEFLITDSNILQNDGVGTELPHGRVNAFISVDVPSKSEGGNVTDAEDKELPEPFTIEYIPSGLFSKTPSMISFFTTDNLSGIEKYQAKDGHSAWRDVTSPLATPKGVVKRSVTVRAIDFAGNIRESSVEIPGLVSSIQLLGIFIAFIACYFVFFVVKRRR